LDISEESPGRAEVETRWASYASKTDIKGASQLAEQAVSLARLEGRPEVAVQAYLSLANTLRKQGKHEDAVRQAEAGISMAREIGDRGNEGRLLNVLGLVALDKRDPAAAKINFEQCLDIARESGNRRHEAPPLNSLGNLAGIVGDYQAAQEYYQQALQIAREVGDRRGEGLVLGNLGWIVSAQGDYGKGRDYYELHRQIAHEVGDRYQETYAAINLSISTLAQGDYNRAMEYAEQGFALARDTGDRSGEAWSLTFLGHVCLEIDKLDAATDAYQAALKIRRSLNQLNLAAEPLAGLAQVALKRDDIPAAQRHVGEILAHLDGGGTLEGAEEPQRVYLTCYYALMAVNNPRAVSILETAHQLLQRRADQISDQTLRRTFLENIPYHLEILTAWEQQQSC
jgi:tetratricopeptide (TPR) repeat protein